MPNYPYRMIAMERLRAQYSGGKILLVYCHFNLPCDNVQATTYMG
jgi:hypothetical protein